MATIFLIAIILLTGYALIMLTRIIRYYSVARTAATMTQPFSRTLRHASKHILVLGDSTMYGAGVMDRNNTIGGLLAGKIPDATVETAATNAARVTDIHNQLSRAEHSHYDITVVGVGANDVVRLRRFSPLRKDLRRALAEVSKMSDQVILCHSVNLGNIGFFLFPMNYFYDYRSRKLSQLYTEITSQFPGVTYVNFYRPMNADYYDKTTRHRFVAEDHFHPSDYANRYFFNIIDAQLKK